MELTRENLEKLLKIHMDRHKFKLCINSYENDAYTVRLIDYIPSHVIIESGQVITVKIQTDLFGDALQAAFKRREHGDTVRSKTEIEFDRLVEQALNLIPRMFVSLARRPVADILAYNPEKKKFKRYTHKQFDKKFPAHKFEKEVSFSLDSRATAIHLRSGLVVREYGRDDEVAMERVRNRIFSLLDSPEVYSEESMKIIEPHEDIIYDLILGAKSLSKEEIKELIRKLQQEYLNA